jgi:MarR family transcriptional regulator, transcriptional regulator for hemolysin
MDTDLVVGSIDHMGRTAELASADAPPALAGNLCWLLSQASHSLMTEFTAAFEDLGVSPRGHSVLVAAMDAERTQTELARIVGLDKTTMVVTVDELEAAGLAERRPSVEDRRARVIAVTKAGERKVREAERIAERIDEDVLGTLSEDDRETLLNSLRQLVCGPLAEPAKCAQPVRRRAPRVTSVT